MSHFSFLKEEDGMAEIVGYNPDRLNHFRMMVENLFRGPSELSIAERELIMTYCSGLNACKFCVGAHQAMAEAYGVDPEKLEALLASDKYEMVEPKLRPVLALAKKLTQSPATVYERDIDAVIDAGWSERAAHDAVCCIATINFLNRLTDGHGVKGSSEYFKNMVKIMGPGAHG
ncbi:carboxymuconolactone decarboxylase family protein [Kineobactrum salinum]|uniref:Peroxidase-related enzyme n=1 Tax=Kineobactrum salinum TaxID=2708301 RepID=A0A6C0U695_9GAMM|nr:peroxidase-related enzyme [Kineobactrum salinum]QIB64964.1 peroxidase-related enzyme [Kineobactrum salinum]